MKKFCLTPLAIALFLLTAATGSALAATQLTINQEGMLAISAGDGQTVTVLPSGSVSEVVQSDNQSFKVSYGKDLRGNTTLIIYPNPENPQSLDLMVFDKPVQMTEDAVLTITGGGSNPQALFQAGVLGTVTVAGNQLPAGGSTTINQSPSTSSPRLEPIASTSPMPKPEALTSDEEFFSATSGRPNKGPSASGNDDSIGGLSPGGDRFGISSNRQRQRTLAGELVPAAGGDSYTLQKGQDPASAGGAYQGLVVREVEGDVMFSKSGADPLEMLRNGVETPRLKPGDIIPPGAQVRTGPNSKVIATPFPGVAIQLQQNTSFGVPLSALIKENGSTKRQFEGYLTKGGVLTAIQGIPPQDIDFKIRTPQGVAAARGTVYAVYTDANRTLVVTEEGTVLVFTPDGTITITVETGKKAIITRQPNGEYTQEGFGAASEELQLLQDFLNDVQDYLDSQFPGGPPDGKFVVDLPGMPLDDLIDTLDPSFNPEDITPTTPQNP